MILTNKYGVPATIEAAVRNDSYSKGAADYSVTELLNPPRLTLLKQRNFDEIEEDVSERIWMLLGKSVHAILDAANVQNALQEERISCEIGGRKISGASDLYHDRTISDYKVTSAWTQVYGSRTAEWTEQLNYYAYLFRSIGFEVNRLEIVCIFRDWSASKALAGGDYPQSPIAVIPVDLWDFEMQEAGLISRIESLKENEMKRDSDLEECGPAEMWEKPAVYAVMKSGRKSSVRNFDSREEAHKFIEENPDKAKLSIQERPGARTRCESYCPVSAFCSQYKKYVEGKK